MQTELYIFILFLIFASIVGGFLAYVCYEQRRELMEREKEITELRIVTLTIFLKANCKTDCYDIERHRENLNVYGYDVIPCRESLSGEPVIFDTSFQILTRLPKNAH